MGTRAVPLRFVCRGCGNESETWNTGNKGHYCSKRCRADHERKGRDAPRRYIQDGYWMLEWTEPGGTGRRPKRGHQFEHDRVWEDAHGPIPDGFIVHHDNEVKTDNRLENLRLMSRADHNRLHNERRGFVPGGRSQAEHARRWRERHPEYKAVHAQRERDRRARKREMAG